MLVPQYTVIKLSTQILVWSYESLYAIYIEGVMPPMTQFTPRESK